MEIMPLCSSITKYGIIPFMENYARIRFMTNYARTMQEFNPGKLIPNIQPRLYDIWQFLS